MSDLRQRWSLAEPANARVSPPSKAAKVVAWLVGFGLLILLVNAALSVALEGVIYPGVKVAQTSLGFRSISAARQVIGNLPEGYKLTIQSQDKSFVTTTGEIGASYNTDETLALAYGVGRGSPPIFGVWRALSSPSLGYIYKIDQQKLSRFTADLVTKIGTPPVNAAVVIRDGEVSKVADKNGLSIKQSTLNTIISQSLNNSDAQQIRISPEPIPAEITTDQLNETVSTTQTILSRSIVVTGRSKQFRPSKADIGHWITFETTKTPSGKKLIAKVDQTQIKGWIQAVANQLNVQPKNKKVTIRDGVTTVDQEGVDGNVVDQDSAVARINQALAANQDDSFELAFKTVPYKTETNNSVSLNYPRYIEVNLSKQRLWAYDNNQPVLYSPITSGASGAGFPTVTGLFHIYYKTTDTYLNGRPYGYNYNVFVKYWMPFYLGYGLHDASWRSSFGGGDYYFGGSHGCVNLPDNTAAFLYSWADVGTPVWVHL